MANSVEERLNNLERRVRELEGAKAALRAKNAPPPPEEEGVRVSYPTTYPIPMPSQSEYERLLSIVERAGVVPRSVEPGEFFAGFVASFERLANLRRLEGLNLRRPAPDWASEAYSWLQQRGTPGETTNGSFFAACVAAGDVRFSFPNSALGIPAYVGLTHDPEARPAVPDWRKVLERGQPCPPEPAPSSQHREPIAAVRIVG